MALLLAIREDVKRLCKQGLHAYASLLQGSPMEGKLIHAHMIQTGFNSDIVLNTKLVGLYAKCGNLLDARQLFDQIPQRNVVSWTAMIAAYANHGYAEEALVLFSQMRCTCVRPNQFTFSTVLPACATLAALCNGKQVHADVITSGFQFDIFVGSALIDMYAKCECLEAARQVFDKMPERNVVSWNAMVAGYAKNGCLDEALKFFQKIPQRNVVSWNAILAGYAQNGHFDETLVLFRQIQLAGVKPNSDTLATILPVCASLAALQLGKQLHVDVIRNGFQSDAFVSSALVDMYAKCGSISNAQNFFEKMLERDVVSSNAMIAGYAHNGHFDEALELFQKIPKQNVISWNALMAGYAQNGHVGEALKLFQNMPDRNVVSWTAMIAGYAQNGFFEAALKLFQQMQLASVKPNSDTFASVLPACSNLAALCEGKELHGEIIKSGFQFNIFVGNALVDMYAKCGSIEDARKMFEKLHRKDVVSWTSIILGYALHGYGNEALQLFEQMQQSGTKPGHITFVGVLSACCHAGLVDDGWQYFNLMIRDYHITPAVQHYCCMVDLLGRAGQLDEAQDFINKMPIKPDAAVWISLISACRIHTDIKIGERVAEQLLESYPKTAANYVLLSNIYAAAGRWDDVEKVRKLMKDRKVKKQPGCSWIEVSNKVHVFCLGDRSHPQAHQIYAELERLSGKMKELGYVSNMNFALHDVEEEQKEHILCHHSEKLAIAFGLINTPPGTLIRIVKNLRVCGDCHNATKFISKIVVREIVVRDANRFHHFKDGLCSCGDYW